VSTQEEAAQKRRLSAEMDDKIDNHVDGRTLEQLESSIHALLCKLVTAPFKLTEPMMIGVLFRPDGSNGFTQT
jgi:hypothetical protein